MTCRLCEESSSPPTCKNGPCQLCVEVAKVDEEINQTLATLRRLHAKRCDLRSEQNRAHDPMHRLPLELKSRIFELVLMVQVKWGRTWLRVGMPPYLTSICRGWRDIAWSIPSVWSTITISLGMRSKSKSSWDHFVHDWILRSRTLPLTLHIKVQTHNDDSAVNLEELHTALEVLSKCPNEWQSLSLEIPTSFSRILYDSDSSFHFHLLNVKRLRIMCTDPWDDYGATQLASPLKQEMNPEEIEIHGLQSLQISWDHLTSATVQDWDLAKVAQLFQNASQMSYCHISHALRPITDVVMPPIVHRKLETLILGSVHREVELPMFLDSLTLPCLRVIQTNVMVAIKIPALVDRSSCPLTGITLFGSRGIELLPDLRALPGVTDLDLKLDAVVVEELLFEGYFPNLRHLTLSPYGFFGLWQAGTIPKLLSSRPDAPNEIPLRKILVRGVDKSEMEGIKQPELLQTCISWREDDIEISIPGVVSSDEDRHPPVLDPGI